jgi:hypothetical protein
MHLEPPWVRVMDYLAGGRECGVPDQIRGAVVELAPSSSLTRTLEPGHEVQRENAAICGFRRSLFAGFRVQTRANPPVEGHARILPSKDTQSTHVLHSSRGSPWARRSGRRQRRTGDARAAGPDGRS